MFHWICPECGREIAPPMLECPACDPQAAPVELAKPLEENILAPESPDVAAPVAAEPVAAVEPEPVIEAAPVVSPEPEPPAPVIESQPEPVAASTAQPSWIQPSLIEIPMKEPPPPVVAPKVEASEISFGELPTAEFQVPELPAPEPDSEPAVAAAPETQPVIVAEAATSVQPEPVPAEPPIPDPPMAALWPYHGPGHYQPRNPKVTPRGGDVDRRMTLPGPALPASLTRHATIIPAFYHNGRRLPGWVVTGSIALGMLALCAVAAVWVIPTSTQASPAPVASTPSTPSTSPPPAQSPSNPLSKYIELTGVRLILDSTKKSEIRYIVVNHSAADLGDLTLHVVLRAASSSNGQPPVSRFSFKLDKLGPWEAREMASSIETSAKSVNIPDWTNLKAEFQITSP